MIRVREKQMTRYAFSSREVSVLRLLYNTYVPHLLWCVCFVRLIAILFLSCLVAHSVFLANLGFWFGVVFVFFLS